MGPRRELPADENNVAGQEQMVTTYEENLRFQLQALPQLWDAFVANGVTPEAELILEFVYYAPNRSSAQRLSDSLHDYETELQSTGLLKKQWRVEGKSHATPVSLEILQQWVGFMVAAGWEHDCEFDGFGAKTPGAAR